MDLSAKTPFSLDFDLITGQCLSGRAEPTRRYVSDMVSQFADTRAAEEIARSGDRLLYEFYELDIPEQPNQLRFGTSIVYPGLVGDEYAMTKGHFHTVLEAPEVYYCLSGEGIMLMESPEGDVDAQKMTPGVAVYVAGRYAHRSVNTGKAPLVTFFVFQSDAGHDYGTIEQKGYRKLVVDRGGKPELIDNPKWK